MRRLVFVALAMPVLASPSVAGELQVISMTEAGVLAMDPAEKVYEHPGHFRTKAELVLPKPEPYYGLMIERVEIAQEWECNRGERKTTRRNFYTGNGRYVRTEPSNQTWSKVQPESDHAPLIEAVCKGKPLVKAERFSDVNALKDAYRKRLAKGEVAKASSALVSEARRGSAAD